MKTILLLFLFILLSGIANSTAQLSIHTGKKCINCHINYQGSGTRNEFGWSTVKKYAVIHPELAGFLQSFYDAATPANSAFDESLYFGANIRAQLATSLKSKSTRRFFVKQINFHASYEAVDWLHFDGNYNFGEILYDLHGQEAWTASAHIFLPGDLPEIRLGHFQPSIGVRYDDHTMLIRQLANNFIYASPLVAVDYSEYGSELNYEIWSPGAEFSLNGIAGIFTSANLAKVKILTAEGEKKIISGNKPSFNAKLTFNEEKGFADFTNSYAGISAFNNTDLLVFNGFWGIGLWKRFALFGEYCYGVKSSKFQLNNTLLGINLRVCDPLYLEIRAERAISDYKEIGIVNKTEQIVLASQIFLLPFIELKPEYRFLQTEQMPRELPQFRGGLFYLQVHLFY